MLKCVGKLVPALFLLMESTQLLTSFWTSLKPARLFWNLLTKGLSTESWCSELVELRPNCTSELCCYSCLPAGETDRHPSENSGNIYSMKFILKSVFSLLKLVSPLVSKRHFSLYPQLRLSWQLLLELSIDVLSASVPWRCWFHLTVSHACTLRLSLQPCCKLWTLMLAVICEYTCTEVLYILF